MSLKHTLQHSTSGVSELTEEIDTSVSGSESESETESRDKEATQAVNIKKQVMRADVEKRFA